MDYEELAREMINIFPKISKPTALAHVSSLGKGEFMILAFLKRNGSMTAGKIAELTNVSNARTTAIIDSLEKKNYVERKPVEGDRRKILVTLSNKGEQFVIDHYEEGVKKVKELLEFLGEEDSRSLVRIISRCSEFCKEGENE